MNRLTPLLFALALPFLPSCERQQSPDHLTPSTADNATIDIIPTLDPAPAEPTTPEPAAMPVVTLTTTLGDIVIELNPEAAPLTVANFLQYVRDGHYDGTVFHRVIDGFMIQGGGMQLQDGNLIEKPTREPIINEAANGLTNDRGTIAMARTNNPNSATAQFFINVVDNNNLNRPNPDGHGYAVFGRVTAGMDTVDKIKSVPTGPGDVPAEPVVITSATVAE